MKLAALLNELLELDEEFEHGDISNEEYRNMCRQINQDITQVRYDTCVAERATDLYDSENK